jgi:hypothetical protein
MPYVRKPLAKHLPTTYNWAKIYPHMANYICRCLQFTKVKKKKNTSVIWSQNNKKRVQITYVNVCNLQK